MPARDAKDRNTADSENIRLLWQPYKWVEIHRPDMGCNPGTCTVAACLTETQLSVLRQLIMLPLQLDFSPFDKETVEELWLLLIGDDFEVLL